MKYVTVFPGSNRNKFLFGLKHAQRKLTTVNTVLQENVPFSFKEMGIGRRISSSNRGYTTYTFNVVLTAEYAREHHTTPLQHRDILHILANI